MLPRIPRPGHDGLGLDKCQLDLLKTIGQPVHGQLQRAHLRADNQVRKGILPGQHVLKGRRQPFGACAPEQQGLVNRQALASLDRNGLRLGGRLGQAVNVRGVCHVKTLVMA